MCNDDFWWLHLWTWICKDEKKRACSLSLSLTLTHKMQEIQNTIVSHTTTHFSTQTAQLYNDIETSKASGECYAGLLKWIYIYTFVCEKLHDVTFRTRWSSWYETLDQQRTGLQFVILLVKCLLNTFLLNYFYLHYFSSCSSSQSLFRGEWQSGHEQT